MTGYDAVIIECSEKIDQLKDFLARGAVASFEDYKLICGELKGLLHIREYTLTLKQRMETQDDE